MPRVEPDAGTALLTPLPAAPAPLVYPLLPEDELETPPLPREHPPWVRDALAVSQRAKALIARLKPVVVRVLTFWDHRLRAVSVAGRRVSVDPAGSYRVE